jgi:transcriptional regulator with XRE-family HTH domain
LAGVREQLADDGECRGQQGRAGDTHQRAERDQQLRARRERRPRGADAEHRRAGQQQPQPAVPVAEVAERDEQRADREAVDVQDPQRLVGGRGEGLADPRHRQEQDRAVHRDEQDRSEDHEEAEPGMGTSSHGFDRPPTRRRQPASVVGIPSRYTLSCQELPRLDGVESLGAFLKNRRDRVTPADIGLRTYGTSRRVPGLRREELAQLAGVSAGYYTRLEQGQAETASAQVLDALARVLDLDEIETVHLHNLARQPARPFLSAPGTEEPHPRVLALLSSLGEATPARVLGRRGDVLAWNRTGHALIAEHLPFSAPRDPARRPSIPRMLFLDPLTRDLYRNWAELARAHVSFLRLTAGRYPTDARLAELIGELTMRSDDFATLWATGDVADCTIGTMLLRHPTVGAVSVDYQVWLQPDSPDHRLEIFTPNDPGSADALRLLTQ